MTAASLTEVRSTRSPSGVKTALNPVGADNATGGKGRDKDRGTFYIGPMQFPLARGMSDTYEN